MSNREWADRAYEWAVHHVSLGGGMAWVTDDFLWAESVMPGYLNTREHTPEMAAWVLAYRMEGH